ncbi:MAG: hypothetical protein AseanaTS_28610 [Candidatus Pelagadaptatus aseana]|uniref:hypothetical protein n=1 Tax=Candidatus Pelagadaptatus aseana TaxID=3120508 RepID=UPI0039B1AA3D
MNVCFNSLELKVPPVTADRLLAKGFENCDYDDWGFSPQLFSFKAFVGNITDEVTRLELETIWTNWINRDKQGNGNDQTLTIEFESEDVPPVAVINAMIEWLKAEQLDFDLNYRYRLENENWQGQLQANHHH